MKEQMTSNKMRAQVLAIDPQTGKRATEEYQCETISTWYVSRPLAYRVPR
jgi:hypothetical protein